MAERYGAWGLKNSYGREYVGLIRSSFLVDPDGRIAKAWPKVKADGHAAQVLDRAERGEGGARGLVTAAL